MNLLVPPNYLTDLVYLEGLHQPLEEIAEVLDEQNRPHHALAIRDTIMIIHIYKEVLIKKNATLHILT